MNKLIILTCSCHKGHLYLIGEDARIVKVVKTTKVLCPFSIVGPEILPIGYRISGGYAHKTVTDIQTLLLALTR